MWTSNLGNKYPKDAIERLDSAHHTELRRLRKEPANALCAECGEGGTAWASVSLGVFICVRCADVHRALGTHISKVKGCGGTYLWGPDEIQQMRSIGNKVAEAKYGGACKEARPAPGASKEERIELCKKKYELRVWAPAATGGCPASEAKAAAAVRRPVPQRLGSVAEPDDLFKDFDVPSKVSPVDVLHGSQWWAGDVRQSLTHVATPGASTAASEEDLDVLLEKGLLGPEHTCRKLSQVAPAAAPRKLSQPQDAAVLWDNFGDW